MYRCTSGTFRCLQLPKFPNVALPHVRKNNEQMFFVKFLFCLPALLWYRHCSTFHCFLFLLSWSDMSKSGLLWSACPVDVFRRQGLDRDWHHEVRYVWIVVLDLLTKQDVWHERLTKLVDEQSRWRGLELWSGLPVLPNLEKNIPPNSHKGNQSGVKLVPRFPKLAYAEGKSRMEANCQRQRRLKADQKQTHWDWRPGDRTQPNANEPSKGDPHLDWKPSSELSENNNCLSIVWHRFVKPLDFFAGIVTFVFLSISIPSGFLNYLLLLTRCQWIVQIWCDCQMWRRCPRSHHLSLPSQSIFEDYHCVQ